MSIADWCLFWIIGLGATVRWVISWEAALAIIMMIEILDKAPRLSISIVIWILSSDTVCQLNQFNTNSEAAMLSMKYLRLSYFSVVMCKIWRTLFIRILHFQNPWRMGPSGLDPEGQAFVEVSSWIDMLIYSDTAMISGRRHLKTWKTLKEKALQLTQTSSSVWEWPSEDKRAWEKG